MIKKSFITQMSYPITDEEKLRAKNLLTYTDHSKKALKKAKEFLNKIKIPFTNSEKANEEINPNDVIGSRFWLRKFRDICIDNFNKFKEYALYTFSIFEYFSSDNQILGLMKGLSSSIDDLEDEVNKFSGIFDNLDSGTFKDDILRYIKSIEDKCDIIFNLIEKRIQPYIYKNVLGTNWMDSVNNKVRIMPQKRQPLIPTIFNIYQNKR